MLDWEIHLLLIKNLKCFSHRHLWKVNCICIFASLKWRGPSISIFSIRYLSLPTNPSYRNLALYTAITPQWCITIICSSLSNCDFCTRPPHRVKLGCYWNGLFWLTARSKNLKFESLHLEFLQPCLIFYLASIILPSCPFLLLPLKLHEEEKFHCHSCLLAISTCFYVFSIFIKIYKHTHCT